MSMHMIHGVRVFGNTKSKPKKIDFKEMDEERRRYNKEMRRRGLHSAQVHSVTEYTKLASNSLKYKKEFKTYTPPQKTYRRATGNYQSRDIGMSVAAKRENTMYTGTLVKGIATMHKSNAVPVIDEQAAKEISQMRRN